MNSSFIWYAIVLLAVVMELFVPGSLVCIWFALGGFMGLLAYYLNLTPIYQWLIFLTTSILSILFLKPLVDKRLAKGGYTPTNADKLIGTEHILIEPITAVKWGKVKINDQEWSVKADAKEEIRAGETVKVVAIEGVKLIVKKV